MNAKKEFSIPFNYEAQKTDKGNWVLPIEILGEGKVAHAYGETKKECQVNAQRIVNGVNVLSAIEKKIAVLEKHSSEKQISSNGIILLAVYKELLKQVGQK